MSSYNISETTTSANFGFIRWAGLRPQLAMQRVRTFRKPGLNGLGQQTISKTGKPFNVDLLSVFANENDARTAEQAYANLINLAADITYEGTSYSIAPYLHRYLVHDVVTSEVRYTPLSMGANWNIPNAWLVQSAWVFIPVVV